LNTTLWHFVRESIFERNGNNKNDKIHCYKSAPFQFCDWAPAEKGTRIQKVVHERSCPAFMIVTSSLENSRWLSLEGTSMSSTVQETSTINPVKRKWWDWPSRKCNYLKSLITTSGMNAITINQRGSEDQTWSRLLQALAFIHSLYSQATIPISIFLVHFHSITYSITKNLAFVEPISTLIPTKRL